ncbi:MAG: hypothetical protein AAFS11_10020 [Planctomycetota bacterium]
MLRARVKLIPHDECSWAVLPPSKGRNRKREELGFEFERFLPHPIEHYAIDFVRQDDGSCIALAVERGTVERARGTHDAVQPETVLDFAKSDVSPKMFELARGSLRSTRVQRLQRLTAAASVSLVAASSILITLGLTARTHRLGDETSTLRTLAAETYGIVIPTDAPAGQPRSIVVQGLLRQSRQAATTAADLAMPDVRADVAATLASWPASDARLRQLSINRDAATIEVLLGADVDASLILEAFGAVPGWQPSAPAVRRTGSDQRVTIRLIRASVEPES